MSEIPALPVNPVDTIPVIAKVSADNSTVKPDDGDIPRSLEKKLDVLLECLRFAPSDELKIQLIKRIAALI